jgi:hypothetical protein
MGVRLARIQFVTTITMGMSPTFERHDIDYHSSSKIKTVPNNSITHPPTIHIGQSETCFPPRTTSVRTLAHTPPIPPTSSLRDLHAPISLQNLPTSFYAPVLPILPIFPTSPTSPPSPSEPRRWYRSSLTLRVANILLALSGLIIVLIAWPSWRASVASLVLVLTPSHNLRNDPSNPTVDTCCSLL